ncbi:MAG: hypothetical protein LW854_12705 [Rubrivivax sp.]|jgi:predicted Zn finger-like uncharacterized protein|nr:hypothetical protein [Rubrivivax sp.]
MTLAQGIRTVGFRKWYERRLLRGHAHLVLVLLGTLGAMAALEAATRFATPAERILDWGVVIACAGFSLWALRRYLFLLTHAEGVAHQANCPHCQAYGRLELVQANAAGDEVGVRCKQCGHHWLIVS